MKHAILVARLMFGIPLILFACMGFFVVMPDPHAFWEKQEGFDEKAAELILMMYDSGFLMGSVAVAHLISGLFCIANRFVPLALLMHLPVSIQMLLFHLFLDPASGLIAYIVVGLNLFLIVAYRDSYQDLLRAKANPIETPAPAGAQEPS